MTSGEHLSAADLAMYIDRAASDLARQRTERHLSDCAQCREELAACDPLARSLPSKRRTGILVSGLGVAAAAVVATFIAMRPTNPPNDATQERGIGGPAGELAIVSPRPGASVPAKNIRFTWRADSGAAGYSVIVTTGAGSPVWKGETSDTSVAPPPVTKFVDGEFYWRVESARVNGGTATSRITSFRVVDR